MLARTPADSEIFAGNRAVGRIALAVAAASGESRRRNVHEAGSLARAFPECGRKRCSTPSSSTPPAAWRAATASTSTSSVGAGARLTVTTAAAEKVYRSLGPDTEVGVKLDVGPGGALAWLPQETILFDRVRLRRTIDVDLAP